MGGVKRNARVGEVGTNSRLSMDKGILFKTVLVACINFHNIVADRVPVGVVDEVLPIVVFLAVVIVTTSNNTMATKAPLVYKKASLALAISPKILLVN